MATAIGSPVAIPVRKDPERFRRFGLQAGYAISIALILLVGGYGARYYLLPLAQRASSPLHESFKPGGVVGIRLGILAFSLYAVLFVYPVRKRVAWLGRIGKTRNWLDVHVLCGLVAPFIATLHSSFKFRGLAGVAYWIMILVAVSGVVGRYLYGQIPRRLNTAELSHSELDTLVNELAAQMESFSLMTAAEVASLLKLPTREEVRRMPFFMVFFTMLWLDLKRPFQVRELRVRYLAPSERRRTLFGLLPSSKADLEQVISCVRRQAWLRAKMLFLEHVQKVFHLWHVVHRPFSYSFAALVAIHLGVVLLMGYF